MKLRLSVYNREVMADVEYIIIILILLQVVIVMVAIAITVIMVMYVVIRRSVYILR